MNYLSSSKDSVLFTPGPLTTSLSVKQAMLHDLGSRDVRFVDLVRDTRKKLLGLAGVTSDEYTTVLLQGSGTFGLEAVVNTAFAKNGKLLVGVNGAYGKRMVKIAELLGVPVVAAIFPENAPVTARDIASALAADPAITHVSVCHCETTSGILNPVQAIGNEVHKAGRKFIVDAMSSLGAIPLSMKDCHIDFLISSANKCIEGVPGLCFVIANLQTLLTCQGQARSLCLDLVDQYLGLENNGQFRFTPPTHVVLALSQALNELDQEGGPAARGERYKANHAVLVEGMKELGFKCYLPSELQSYIITSFLCPTHPNFNFETFYRRLGDEGKVIYPGKVGDADCFRIGTIGRLTPADFRDLLASIRHVKEQMGF